MWWELILNALLLGVGLAMDACAVSMANGLNEPKMRVGKITLIAASFAFFQALMPMIGWTAVHFIARQFEVVTKAIPYIALALLSFIGGKMIFDGVRHKKDEEEKPIKKLTVGVLLVQSLATSIDALSVGFTIANHDVTKALVTVAIIAAVTFIICFGAVFLGKKFGTALGNKAVIVGGVILIAIGIEIFVKGVFFS